MKSKKILYLVMSSNNDFFRHQNEIIRNTWGKDVDVLFYEGDYYIDNINGDVLELNCKDTIDWTYAKTYYALKYVKEKINLFPRWYNSFTSNIIIQGIGRGNRFANDWCKTYIFDACFLSLYNATKNQYPVELQRRIKIVN